MTPLSRLNRKHSKARGNGFTLIELLVVIAIVGILAGIILPSLSRAKGKGYTVACLNNHRQLALAWNVYADEHEDYLAYNYGTAGTLGTIASGQYLNWANNVMSWDLQPYNTNILQLAAGGLGQYLSGVVQPYRCPADRYLSPEQRAAGWRERTRSISMNAMLGYAGEFMDGGSNTNNPYYKQFLKLSQIVNPSGIFVFIDEHPDSINDGYFLAKIDSYKWFDLPGAYHDGGANLSFADMHVEYRRWVASSTLRPIEYRPPDLPSEVIPEDQDADYEWLMERVSYRDGSKYYSSSSNQAYGK